ncbi:hypothetical protein [Kitasatospora sp. NPDC088783]|uniref:hypothetical protein n=1 Tax=Kitasatospora sp. NPDC088783 TaxID=3364077 RepID=UPI00380589E5
MPAAEPGKRGRRPEYCSTACKSKAVRDKARVEAVRSGEGPQAEMLRCAGLAVDAVRVFLDAVDDDPVAAFEAYWRSTVQARAREAEAQRKRRRAEEVLYHPDLLSRISQESGGREQAAPGRPGGPGVPDQ